MTRRRNRSTPSPQLSETSNDGIFDVTDLLSEGEKRPQASPSSVEKEEAAAEAVARVKKARPRLWSTNRTDLLISLYTPIVCSKGGCMTTRDWESIVDRLNNCESNDGMPSETVKRCRDKIDKLRKSYREARQKQNKEWPYYERMRIIVRALSHRLSVSTALDYTPSPSSESQSLPRSPLRSPGTVGHDHGAPGNIDSGFAKGAVNGASHRTQCRDEYYRQGKDKQKVPRGVNVSPMTSLYDIEDVDDDSEEWLGQPRHYSKGECSRKRKAGSELETIEKFMDFYMQAESKNLRFHKGIWNGLSDLNSIFSNKGARKK
ncbi:hypothetical protein L7F22_067448 [Adiantum nelumboides]|nr:hypothetical protein [Adiantum nelumboides]